MAIIGGAGNPVGGSFTGPAEAIEIIGDHAYAYAGLAAAATSIDTRLDFTTGNYYFVGRLTANGSAALDAGNITDWVLSLNGTDVAKLQTETATEDQPPTVYNEIIIPPYTEVKVTSESNGDSAGRMTSCIMTGRIYRTRD
jgi:hypothetical protein